MEESVYDAVSMYKVVDASAYLARGLLSQRAGMAGSIADVVTMSARPLRIPHRRTIHSSFLSTLFIQPFSLSIPYAHSYIASN